MKRRYRLAATGLWFAGCVLLAEDPAYARRELLDNPPLGAKAAGKVAKKGDAEKENLELRGFFGRGDDLYVSLWRMDTREAVWVSVKAKDGRYRIDRADPRDGSVDVTVDGQKRRLRLAKTDGAPLAIPVAPSLPAPAPGTLPVNPGPVPAAPAPAAAPVPTVPPADEPSGARPPKRLRP